MEWFFKWLMDSTIWEIIASFLVFALFIAVIAIVIVYLALKIKPKKIGNIEIGEGLDKSIVNHPDVRDYRYQLIYIFDCIKDDLRYRVRTNGWEKIADFMEYKDKAGIEFDILLSNKLDEHYYSNARIPRDELKKWNSIIWPKIKDCYSQMFENMLSIIKDGYKTIDYKRKQLQELIDNKKCGRLKKCPIAVDIIRLTTEINLHENITVRERCMIEAERALLEILQNYYDHYIEKYKEVIK